MATALFLADAVQRLTVADENTAGRNRQRRASAEVIASQVAAADDLELCDLYD